MSDGSNIGWLAAPGFRPASWNPLRAVRLGRSAREDKRGWACVRISPGCERCYAEGLNVRLGTGERYRLGAPVTHYLDHRVLAQPLHWRAPRMIFPCSMTDLFGLWVPDEQIAAIFGVMAVTPQHRYVVLTKRIERAARMLSGCSASAIGEGAPEIGASLRGVSWPLPNVLIGPSVEDQQRADERMPHAMRLAEQGWRVVVSCEPMLGPIDLDGDELGGPGWLRGYHAEPTHACGGDERECARRCPEAEQVQNPRISWLIVGAESGRDRRPCEPERVTSLARQCSDAGVPAFVKQGSAFKPGQQGDLRDDVWAYKQFPREMGLDTP